ncbi:peptidase M20 domain-containing protein 2-like [Dermacentor variabilis]|uniref:peptidase M20 domain-containing protein 2-like n=1 Tax=Dermacentor variabilis TaxID=34621 RepID=UPI003F5BEA7E
MARNLKELVHNVVEAKSQDLWELSRFVWEHPELALNEVQCHDWLTDFLEQRGFSVTRHYLLDTAFKAEFEAPGGTQGPCVALLCEYDALADIGHACGHNLIAEASIGAALAVSEAMKNHEDIRGKVVVLGTPAEESRCGKGLLIRKGALQGVDAALMAHPSPSDVLVIGFAATQQPIFRTAAVAPKGLSCVEERFEISITKNHGKLNKCDQDGSQTTQSGHSGTPGMRWVGHCELGDNEVSENNGWHVKMNKKKRRPTRNRSSPTEPSNYGGSS